MMMSTTNKMNISREGSNGNVPSDHPIRQDCSILDGSFYNECTTTTTDTNKNSNNIDNVEDTNDQDLDLLSPNTTAPVDMWTKQFYDVSFTYSPSSPHPSSSSWSPSPTLLTSVSKSIPNHNESFSSPPQSILKRSQSFSPSSFHHTNVNQNNNNNDKTDSKNCHATFSGTTFPTTPVSSSIGRLFQTPIGTIDFSMKRRKTTAAAYSNENEDSQGDSSSANGTTTSSSDDDDDLSSSSVVVDRNVGDIGNTDVVRDVMEAFQKNLVFLDGNDTNNNDNNEKSFTTDQTTWINKNQVTAENQTVTTASTLIEISCSDSSSSDQADPSTNDIASVFDSFALFENL